MKLSGGIISAGLFIGNIRPSKGLGIKGVSTAHWHVTPIFDFRFVESYFECECIIGVLAFILPDKHSDIAYPLILVQMCLKRIPGPSFMLDHWPS